MKIKSPCTQLHGVFFYHMTFHTAALYSVMSEDDSRKRVRYRSHSISIYQLKPGDHIYAYRKLAVYSHHGIYVGEAETEVIHFCGEKESDKFGSNSKSKVSITRCTLKKFCNGATLRLVAYNVDPFEMHVSRPGTCHTEESDREVLSRAKYFLDHPKKWKEYHFIYNNCENFAFFCNTGRRDNPDGQTKLLQQILPKYKQAKSEDFSLGAKVPISSLHPINLDQVKPGDHICTNRDGCAHSHHGIYVGGDENGVIHL